MARRPAREVDAMEVDLVRAVEEQHLRRAAPLVEVVCDTNVLLGALPALDHGLRALASQAEQAGGSLAIRVPNVVLAELDGLKMSALAEKAAAARRAIAWLQRELRAGGGFVAGQTKAQARAADGAYAPLEGQRRVADDRVVGCAMQARDAMADAVVAGASACLVPPVGAVVVSNDRDLCVKCMVEGIAAFGVDEAPQTLDALVAAARRSLEGGVLERAAERARRGTGDAFDASSNKPPRECAQHPPPPAAEGDRRPHSRFSAADAACWHEILIERLERAAEPCIIAMLAAEFGEPTWRHVAREEPPWDARSALEMLRQQGSLKDEQRLRRVRDEQARLLDLVKARSPPATAKAAAVALADAAALAMALATAAAAVAGEAAAAVAKYEARELQLLRQAVLSPPPAQSGTERLPSGQNASGDDAMMLG